MTTVIKQSEYYLFVRFIATPEPFRELKTQQEFQMEYNVSGDTLARWKKDPNFWDDVKREIREWAKAKTPDVIAALYVKSVRKGDPLAIKLWLQYIEEFSEKETRKLEVGETLADILKREWLEDKKKQELPNGNIQ